MVPPLTSQPGETGKNTVWNCTVTDSSGTRNIRDSYVQVNMGMFTDLTEIQSGQHGRPSQTLHAQSPDRTKDIERRKYGVPHLDADNTDAKELKATMFETAKPEAGGDALT